MKFIVDIQGFQAPTEFIVKEFCIVKIDASPQIVGNDESDVTCLLFEPPYSWSNLTAKYQQSNLWLTHKYHGIPWSAGDIPYNQLWDQIHNKLADATYIFVKGEEKKKLLERNLQISTTIIDLQDIGCPTLKNLRVSACIFFNFHRNTPNHHCAAENGRRLRIWFLEKFGYGPTFKRTITLLQHSRFLHKLDDDDLAVLPQEFLLTYHSQDIDSVWDKLPKSYHHNPEIAACRLCLKHWPKAVDGYDYDVIDGIAPMIRECNHCIKSLNKINKKCLYLYICINFIGDI